MHEIELISEAFEGWPRMQIQTVPQLPGRQGLVLLEGYDWPSGIPTFDVWFVQGSLQGAVLTFDTLERLTIWDTPSAGTIRWGSTKHTKSTKDPGRGGDCPRQNPLTGPSELRNPVEIHFRPAESRPFASFVDNSPHPSVPRWGA